MCTAEDMEVLDIGQDPRSGLPKPSPGRPNVAVASSSGRAINLHLGQAPRLLIYGPRADGRLSFLGSRPVPAAGSGASREGNHGGGSESAHAMGSKRLQGAPDARKRPASNTTVCEQAADKADGVPCDRLPSRWLELGSQLTDCFVLLAAEAGVNPRAVLASLDVPVLTGEGSVRDALGVLYGEGMDEAADSSPEEQ